MLVCSMWVFSTLPDEPKPTNRLGHISSFRGIIDQLYLHRGCFHKSTTEMWLWRGNLRVFLQVKRAGKVILQEQWPAVEPYVVVEPYG